jgi:cell division septation protein DedD
VPQPEASTGGGVIKVKSSSVGQYSVQVGSYPKMEEASARVEDWRKKGYPSFMMIADIPDRGRWYRVRIGGFGTKEEAQAYLDKFKQSESVDGIVVLNEQ